MAEIPFIDLHPDKIRGTGPETALLACREFISNSLLRGHRSLRIITGLGIHGDGTPRLRSRVEQEVLGGFHSQIESRSYEQGGAVIRLELKSGFARQGKEHQTKAQKELQHKAYVRREERLMVAFERLEAAEGYFDEGDFRKCRLKLNQVLREFFPDETGPGPEHGILGQYLKELKKRMETLP